MEIFGSEADTGTICWDTVTGLWKGVKQNRTLSPELSLTQLIPNVLYSFVSRLNGDCLNKERCTVVYWSSTVPDSTPWSSSCAALVFEHWWWQSRNRCRYAESVRIGIVILCMMRNGRANWNSPAALPEEDNAVTVIWLIKAFRTNQGEHFMQCLWYQKSSST